MGARMTKGSTQNKSEQETKENGYRIKNKECIFSFSSKAAISLKTNQGLRTSLVHDARSNAKAGANAGQDNEITNTHPALRQLAQCVCNKKLDSWMVVYGGVWWCMVV